VKLFVIGAAGRTGREIVEQALPRGHQVTAFVRSPECIKFKNERLTVIEGNAMDENELVNAMHVESAF
jgi:putative NADH-flavin reductase